MQESEVEKAAEVLDISDSVILESVREEASQPSDPAAADQVGLSAHLFSLQYSALRSEIDRRIDIRQQILYLTLVVGGAFLTVGLQPNISELVILFYPILAMFLAASWTHNDLRIGQIDYFIQTEVEKHLGGLAPGWEDFRRRTFLPSRKQTHIGKTNSGHLLAPPRGLIAFSTRGIFLTTQVIAMLIAVGRYLTEGVPGFALTLYSLQHGFPTELSSLKTLGTFGAELVLFVVDVIATTYSMYIIRHRRESATDTQIN